jgi:hypothetical protein
VSILLTRNSRTKAADRPFSNLFQPAFSTQFHREALEKAADTSARSARGGVLEQYVEHALNSAFRKSRIPGSDAQAPAQGGLSR